MTRTKILRWLGCLASATLLAYGSAQTGVGIQPAASRLDAPPGETTSGVWTIDNPSRADLEVTLSIADWVFDDLGRIEYLPSGTIEETVAPWLTYEPTSLIVPAESSAEVRYSIDVPVDAHPGTRWGVVFAEATAETQSSDTTAATMRVRTGHALYVDVSGEDATLDGTIGGMFAVPPTSTNGPVRLGVQYLNTGDYVQFVRGSVEILDLGGAAISSIGIPGFAVLPGFGRTVRTELYGPLPEGQYLALAVLTDRVETRELTADTVFQLDQALGDPSGTEEGP